MAFTYDPTTDAGRVRLLCYDTDASNEIFSDAEIDAFIELEPDSVKRAAALAVETIARQEVMVLKVAKFMDIWTDGARVADTLMRTAAQLRSQADDDDARAGDLVDFAEFASIPFGAQQRYYNEGLRGLA